MGGSVRSAGKMQEEVGRSVTVVGRGGEGVHKIEYALNDCRPPAVLTRKRECDVHAEMDLDVWLVLQPQRLDEDTQAMMKRGT